MANPLVEQIAQDVLNTVRTVTTGNGYNFTLSVNRHKRKGDDVKHLDAIIIQEDPRLVEEPKVYNTLEWIAPFSIGVFIMPPENDPTTPIDTYVNQIVADVQKALMIDRYRGNLALDTKIVAARKSEQHLEYDCAIIVAEVNYRTPELDPYVNASGYTPNNGNLLPIYFYSTPGNSWLTGYNNTSTLPDWASLGYHRYNSVIAGQARLNASQQSDWTSWAQQLAYGGGTHGDIQDEVDALLDGARGTLDATELSKLLGAVTTVKANDPGFSLGLYGVPWASDNKQVSIANSLQQMIDAGITAKLDFGIAAFDLATYSGVTDAASALAFVQKIGIQVEFYMQSWGPGKPIVWNLFPYFIDGGRIPLNIWEYLITAVVQTAKPTRGDLINVLAGIDNLGAAQNYTPTLDDGYFNLLSDLVGSVKRVS